MQKIKLMITVFLTMISVSLFAQSNSNLRYLEKVYAQNCDKSPHEIIYFIDTPKYGLVSLYPERNASKNTMSITGSAWGFFYRQTGEVTSFQKNGFIESRSVWIRGNRLALVHSNGQFRDKQKFYQLCAANSAASQLTLSGDTIKESLSRFEKFEDRMQENKKSSECSTFHAASQSCAAASSYEKCISIRWGNDWATKEARCK